MKKFFIIVISLAMPVLLNAHNEEDHEQKFSDLKQVSNAFPGTGHVMIELSFRYSALYFAAKENNWAFANYQVEEIEELMERFKIISKKREKSIDKFMHEAIEDIEKAVETKKWKTFEISFNKMRGMCMACHAENKVEFINVPIPKSHNSLSME